MEDARLVRLNLWVRTVARQLDFEVSETARLVPVSDDASFRRYFRLPGSGKNGRGLIFVDAPPEQEENEAFIKVSKALNDQGLACPEVLKADLDQGFLVVTDLGDSPYLGAITADPARVEPLYSSAVESLLQMLGTRCELAQYDETRLRLEMELFPDWFIKEALNLELIDEQRRLFTDVEDVLIDSALAQPQMFVHRDYHSRNLMVLDTKGPGILDFQDAVVGPVTYDLVSLFKDCYYRLDRNRVIAWVEQFRKRLQSMDLIEDVGPMDFLKWFDLMGVQRHLKCAGIFSRLDARDGKPGYLPDIPLVVNYLIEASELYEELHALHAWLISDISPRLDGPQFVRGKGA